MVWAWPEAIHLGHGQALPIFDPSADDAQRSAMPTIMAGQASTPGKTVFDIFASTCETVHDPLFEPIDFEVDLEARSGRFSVPGVMDCSVGPIVNPVTGDQHRAQITLPHGVEYHTAEVASGDLKAEGPIEIEYQARHAHLAMLHMGADGPIS